MVPSCSNTIHRPEDSQRWHFASLQTSYHLIKSFFGLLTYDMRGGIHLADGTVHTGERVRLFATLSMVLQDGGAQKLVWGCKGDAGTKPCMLCHNLVSKPSGLAGGGRGLVDDFTSEAGLTLATDDNIRVAINQFCRCR